MCGGGGFYLPVWAIPFYVVALGVGQLSEIPKVAADMVENTKKDFVFRLKKIEASIGNPKLDDGLLNFQKCLIYEGQGDKKKQKEAIFSFMKEHPKSYIPAFFMAMHYFNKNKFAEAVRYLELSGYNPEEEESKEKEMILCREQFTGATKNLQSYMKGSVETVSKFMSFGSSYFNNLTQHFTETIKNDFKNNYQLLSKMNQKSINKYIQPHEYYFFLATSYYNSRQYVLAASHYETAIRYAEKENRNCLDVFHFNLALNNFFVSITFSYPFNDQCLLKARYYAYKEYNIDVLITLICEFYGLEFEGKGFEKHFKHLESLKNPKAMELYDQWKKEIQNVRNEKKSIENFEILMKKEYQDDEQNAKKILSVQ